MDSSLNFIKTTILSNPEASQDQFKAARLFKSLYEATKVTINTTTRNNRTIGGQRTHGRFGYGRGSGRGSGRGRGRGRGNGGGRGYGNNYGRGRGGYQNNGQGRGQGDTLFISPQILRQMTPSQRKAFFTGCDALQKQHNDTDNHDDCRIVGGQHQEQGQVNEEIPAQAQQPRVTFDAASDQFGRAGRQLQGRGGGRGRQQGAIKSHNRCTVAGTQAQSQTQESTDYNGRYHLEIDSWADIVCCGKGWKVLYYTGQVVNVSGFHDSFATIQDVPIASCCTMYDHPDGHSYILIAHEVLFFGDSLEHSLIPPAQIWNNGLLCDITPKHCSNGHSIFGILDQATNLHLPFQLYGCIAYLPIWLPHDHDLEDVEHITLTSDAEWNPYSSTFAEKE